LISSYGGRKPGGRHDGPTSTHDDQPPWCSNPASPTEQRQPGIPKDLLHSHTFTLKGRGSTGAGMGGEADRAC